LDGLKLVNDTFGHLEGDKIIQFAAELLKKYYDEDSIVSRIGGDEYAVISDVLSEDVIVDRYNKIMTEVQISNEDSHFDIAISYGHRIVINNDELFETAFAHAENLMYRRKLTDRRSRKSVTLDSLIETLNTKTEETLEHGLRLAEYSVATLKELGYSRVAEVEDMTLLARVHDIGKITVPTSLLFKPTNLTFDEYEQVKQHSEAGYKIIKNIVDSDTIADGVLYHHERVDGKGYPMAIKDEEIPLYAKIISVCDAYDAMTSGRPYALPISREEALKELRDCSGTQFDGKVVEAFIKATDKGDT
jgi:diguanylate cyclase (GGDEF)-like protein